MNFEHLKTFYLVAKSGSFTRAAQQLFLTQPAVSQQIRSLESALGAKLLERSRNKRVLLTQEGEVLLSYADRFISLLEEIKSRFNDLQELRTGELAIGATAVPGTYLLPKPICRFNKLYPEVKISLKIANTLKVIEMLIRKEVDIGFAGEGPHDRNLQRILLHREKLVLVASPSNPLTARGSVNVSDLQRYHFIWREKGTQIRRAMEAWFKKHAGSSCPGKFIEIESMEVTKRLVQEGFGITAMPEIAVSKELELGILKQLKLRDFDAWVGFYLLYLAKASLSMASRAFLTILHSIPLFSNAPILASQFVLHA